MKQFTIAIVVVALLMCWLVVPVMASEDEYDSIDLQGKHVIATWDGILVIEEDFSDAEFHSYPDPKRFDMSHDWFFFPTEDGLFVIAALETSMVTMYIDSSGLHERVSDLFSPNYMELSSAPVSELLKNPRRTTVDVVRNGDTLTAVHTEWALTEGQEPAMGEKVIRHEYYYTGTVTIPDIVWEKGDERVERAPYKSPFCAVVSAGACGCAPMSRPHWMDCDKATFFEDQTIDRVRWYKRVHNPVQNENLLMMVTLETGKRLESFPYRNGGSPDVLLIFPTDNKYTVMIDEFTVVAGKSAHLFSITQDSGRTWDPIFRKEWPGRYPIYNLQSTDWPKQSTGQDKK